jgi:hypothetical protein
VRCAPDEQLDAGHADRDPDDVLSTVAPFLVGGGGSADASALSIALDWTLSKLIPTAWC